MTRMEGETIHLESGRTVTLEELERLADELPLKVPVVIIMPPHEYVVASKLETDEKREPKAFLVRLNVPPAK